MACLLDFSHEMLHAIFTNINPADLAALSKTCSTLNSYIKDNKLLCKDLYLQNWVRDLVGSTSCRIANTSTGLSVRES